MAQQSKKPDKTKNNGAGDTPVGSSWPDVGRDLIKNLGSATPWVLMIAGFGYGFLEFQKLAVKNEETLQNAQIEAIKLYGDHLKTSSEALLTNYAEIQKSTKRQIQNVDAILDVNTKLVSQFEALQEETIKSQASRREIEREADEVRRKKQELETDVATLEGRLTAAKEEAGRQKEIAAIAQQAQGVALKSREDAQKLAAIAKEQAQEHRLKKQELEAQLAVLNDQLAVVKREAERARNEARQAKAKTDKARAEAANKRNEATLAIEQAERAKAEVEAEKKELAKARADAENAMVESRAANEAAAEAWHEVEVAQTEAARLQEELQKTESEAKKGKMEVERLNEEAMLANKQSNNIRRELQKAELKLRTLNKDLDVKKDELERISKGTENTLDERDEWRGRLRKLVEFLKDAKTSEAKALSNKFFEEHFTTPEERIIAQKLKILTDFTENPIDLPLSNTRKFLGMSKKDFSKLVERGAGFNAWLDLGIQFVGFKVKDSGPLIDIVLFATPGDRIIDVTALLDYASVRVPDFNNWYKTTAYRVFERDDKFHAFERPADAGAGKFWQVVREEELEFRRIIFGENIKIRQLEIGEIDQYYPQLLEGGVSERALEFVYVLDMYRRSVDFGRGGKSIRRVDLLPDDLRDTFEALTVDAVWDNAEGLQRVVDPFLGFGDMGKIAAVALKPEFRVIDVRQLEAIHQQQSSQSKSIEVITLHRTLGGEDAKSSFVFEKTVPDQNYLLKKFSTPFVEVSSQLEQ